ncbi:hypothetical protein [Spiroplasma endosymbiont of Virgichneumon dumeticola]|uniref:hypothetical protein n=1 Tax=Spiroplasma endosymbiont of Virgichneumon dumeticola TaxID=3139323 RepID=UPI0035C91945
MLIIEQSNLESQDSDGDAAMNINSNETAWEFAYNHYGAEVVTLTRLDESGKLEYKTEFTSSVIKVINEKFVMIDNKSLWQKVIKLNDGKIILELTNLNDIKQLQQTVKLYQNEQEYNNEWILPIAQFLQENFNWVVIENESNLLNEIFNSKYSFLSIMIILTLSLGSFSLFDDKNNLHEENPLLHLFNDWEDVMISITSGLTMINLSYLNYKIINLISNWKYLSFLVVSTVMGAWKNYLNLYVSENEFDWITFAKGIGVNLSICIIEELIFDKIAQPLIRKIWENLRNKNILKTTGLSAIICLLIFLSALESVISGLFGEQKEINLENVIEALPLALLVTLIENGIYSAYFSYFNLFLPKIKNFIVTPLISGVKWCWSNVTSCFTNSDIIENVANVANNETENKLLEEFIKNKLKNTSIEEVLELVSLLQSNQNEQEIVIPIDDDTTPLLENRECLFPNDVINNLVFIDDHGNSSRTLCL